MVPILGGLVSRDAWKIASVVRDLVLYPERVRPAGRADRQLLTLRPGVVERVTVAGIDVSDVDGLLRAPTCRSVAELFD